MGLVAALVCFVRLYFRTGRAWAWRAGLSAGLALALWTESFGTQERRLALSYIYRESFFPTAEQFVG